MATSIHLFARDFCAAIGVPGSYENALSLIAWRAAEGGGAKFNPYNTTRPMPGATIYNDITLENGEVIHVYSYTSYKQGLDATAQTIRQSNMAPILAALKKGNSAHAFWVALSGTPWGTGTPGGLTIDQWLDDCRRHWFDRAMLVVPGT